MIENETPEKILLIIKTIIPVLILFFGLSCSNNNEQNKAADQNQSAEDHLHVKLKCMMIMTMTSITRPGTMVSMSNQMSMLHAEAEVHDDHEHDPMTRLGTMVSMSNQMNMLHAEAEVHDEHDHDLHDERLITMMSMSNQMYTLRSMPTVRLKYMMSMTMIFMTMRMVACRTRRA